MKHAWLLSVFGLVSSSSLVASAQELPPPPPPELPPLPPPFQLDKKLSGFELASDLTYALSKSQVTHGDGYSVDLRAGYRFAAGDVFFVPGVDLGYVNFTHFDGALRAGLGGRVGADAGILEPSVFAYGGAFLNPFKSGPGVRAGGALDVRVGRWFVPGVHVEGDAAGWDTNSLRYLGVGAHAGFVW